MLIKMQRLGNHALLRSISEHFPLSVIRGTSSATELKVENAPANSRKPLPYFRTLIHDPQNHSVDHEAKFYTVSKAIQNSLYTHGGLTRYFKKQIKTFNECCFMVRKPALELIHYLRIANYSTPAIRYLIYGRTGVGKTVTMAHVLHYAYKAGFIILHVNWVPYWVREQKTEIVPSQYRPGRIDLPNEAVTWLQQFKLQNGDLLKQLQINTSKTYTWTKRESTEEGQPLMTVVDFGINRPKCASDCVGVVGREIKIHASAGRLKALVAVDGLNALFHSTRFKKEDRSKVAADEITLVHVFRKLIKNDWCNAAIIGAVEELANPGDKRGSYQPKFLLGKEGFEHLDPFIPVLINNYSEKEVHSCIDYYIDRLWIQHENGQTEEGKKELIFVSGRNPEKLLSLCGPL